MVLAEHGEDAFNYSSPEYQVGFQLGGIPIAQPQVDKADQYRTPELEYPPAVATGSGREEKERAH